MKKIICVSVVLFFGLIFKSTEAQTTITIQPGASDGKDVSIAEYGNGNPYGDRESLTAYTWTNNSIPGVKRFLLAFDLSLVPENATVTNARLSLFYNPTDPIESFDFHTGENDIYIQRVTSAWHEHTITWDNQPTTTTDKQVKLPPSSSPTQDYLDIDVTSLVIDMADPLIENNGFMIRMVDEINYYKSVLFASSDHVDPALHPKLEITYLPDSVNCITLKPNADEGKDASLWSNDGGINHGDRESLTAYTWTHAGSLSLKRTFLEFDLSSIPENAIIKSAALSLFYNPTDPYESFDFHTGENDMYIQRIISPWDEHLIVWDNQPEVTMENQVKLPPSTSPTQDYLDVDVTDLVVDMTDRSQENYGFLIRMVDEINYYKSVLFASSDHIDSNLHPELRVCYILDSSGQQEEEEIGFDFKLYPNPAIQTFTVEFNKSGLELSLEIFNMQGQLVKKMININPVEIIDISNFASGLYSVRLSGKDIFLVKKLVVQ